MSCQNHPNKESVASCQFCGKELCEDCAISIAGKNYCEECMSELVGPELASITAKNPNNETQENDSPNQTPQPKQDPPQHAESTKINPPEETLEPTIEETPMTIEEDDVNNEIHSPDSQNMSNIDDNTHDDIYSDDKLYSDIHEDETPSPSDSSNKIEEKYEKYLDDLYFDENKDQNDFETSENSGFSLSEQLAQDEEEHGSLTKEPFIPEVPEEPNDEEYKKNRNIPIMKNLRNVSSEAEYESEEEEEEEKEEEFEYTISSLHKGSIHYKKEEKEAFSSTEKILTAVLIILIILVGIYLIYLFTLHGQYPNFFDALSAFFEDPGKVLGQMGS